MDQLPVDEKLIRQAFLAALANGKKIHRKTLVKHIAESGALPDAGSAGRHAEDYKPLDLILGDMMLEGLITKNRAMMCRIPTSA